MTFLVLSGFLNIQKVFGSVGNTRGGFLQLILSSSPNFSEGVSLKKVGDNPELENNSRITQDFKTFRTFYSPTFCD